MHNFKTPSIVPARGLLPFPHPLTRRRAGEGTVDRPTAVRLPRLWRQHPVALPLVGGLLVLAVTLIYGQTVGHQFINYDDPAYIVHNPNVLRGLTAQGIGWSFTHFHADNWHPLAWISHHLDCQLYRQWAGGHHLTNVLLHAVTAVLLLLVLLRMTGGCGLRHGGGRVRRASAAGRIGGLGGRTQGPSQRLVLHADALGLHRLCRPAVSRGAATWRSCSCLPWD